MDLRLIERDLPLFDEDRPAMLVVREMYEQFDTAAHELENLDVPKNASIEFAIDVEQPVAHTLRVDDHLPSS